MDFSWTILAAVIIVNSGWIGVMYAAQQLDKSLPSRHSLILGTRQKFLYMQDFYALWGDIFAVPLILNAFAHLVFNGCISFWQWIAFALVAAADAYNFRKICLKSNHKPDLGCPEIGKMSCNGLLHLPYHGVCIAASLLVMLHAVANIKHFAAIYWIALTGGAIYIASVWADKRAGNFDPLKLEP